MAIGNQPLPSARGRGRPIGTDSAETRAAILRAARNVISEHGYEAATFQAIASRAGFSRPTMHYYFHTKEEIYEVLQQEAHAIVSDCIAAAKRENGLFRQLTAFVVEARRADEADGSLMRFIVASRFEQHRCPSLRGSTTPVSEAIAGFYGWIVDRAIAVGEIPADTDADAVVNMLYAMFWGMGFFAGFVHASGEFADIAKQLNGLLCHGLLKSSGGGAISALTPVTMVDDAADSARAYAPPRRFRAVAFGA